jgi:hypothetical protein
VTIVGVFIAFFDAPLHRVDINAGHGAGKSVATIQENVNIQMPYALHMGLTILQE